MSKNTAASRKTSQQKTSELKQEILRVALQHFARKGFAKTNMDEIADELGIHKPSIYYHIGKKEDLFDATIISALDSHLTALKNKLENTSSPKEMLKAYVFAFADNLYGDNRCLANLILRQIANEDTYFPKAALIKMYEVQKILRRILKHGQQQGLFKAVNPFMIHLLIVSFFTTVAAGEHMKQKIADASGDSKILTQKIDLHEGGELIYSMLLDELLPRN